MANSPGTITAEAPGAGVAAPDAGLPDPTSYARWALLGLFLITVALAIILNAAGATGREFKPSATSTANFSLFAGFYVAAQAIERLLELVSPLIPNPLLPGYALPATITSASVKAAQVKADRAKIMLGIATLLGVIASCGFGLLFLKAVGMHASHTVDSLLTGITIAAGTKPLHDFITLIQNQSTPTTGTGTNGSSEPEQQ